MAKISRPGSFNRTLEALGLDVFADPVQREYGPYTGEVGFKRTQAGDVIKGILYIKHGESLLALDVQARGHRVPGNWRHELTFDSLRYLDANGNETLIDLRDNNETNRRIGADALNTMAEFSRQLRNDEYPGVAETLQAMQRYKGATGHEVMKTLAREASLALQEKRGQDASSPALAPSAAPHVRLPAAAAPSI